MAQKAYDSVRDDYMTPSWIVDSLLNIAQTAFFSMDVCCSEANIPADFHAFNGLYDGLTIGWRVSVFLTRLLSIRAIGYARRTTRYKKGMRKRFIWFYRLIGWKLIIIKN